MAAKGKVRYVLFSALKAEEQKKIMDTRVSEGLELKLPISGGEEFLPLSQDLLIAMRGDLKGEHEFLGSVRFLKPTEKSKKLITDRTFVRPGDRRQGIATGLRREILKLAKERYGLPLGGVWSIDIIRIHKRLEKEVGGRALGKPGEGRHRK